MKRVLLSGIIALAACSANVFAIAASQSGHGLRFTGVNIAGADFASKKLPGVPGRDYFFPSRATIDHFADEGMNVIRFPFLWERLQPTLDGMLDPGELQRIAAVVTEANAKGLFVVLDVHNYAAYRRQAIGSSAVPIAAFADLWARLATKFKNDPQVGFGLMNEPKALPTETWLAAANAAIAAIRKAGAKNLIFVPGNGWTGAHSWFSRHYGTPNAVAMLDVSDPADNYVYEVHQYLDSNYSGTHPECQSETIGVETLKPFTAWLREHHKRGFLGEFGAGRDSTCLAALEEMLDFIGKNRDVWLGWTYWAAGAWPPRYFTSVQPVHGVDPPQMAVLLRHLAGKRN